MGVIGMSLGVNFLRRLTSNKGQRSAPKSRAEPSMILGINHGGTSTSGGYRRLHRNILSWYVTGNQSSC